MMNGQDIERARAALQAIPPSLNREDWTRAGMAAKAAGLALEGVPRLFPGGIL